VAWCVQAHGSRAQLEWWAPLARRHFPGSRIVIISDGDDDRYDDLAARYRFDYIRGQHLMALDSADLYVTRLLNALLAGPETYLFRIDPDARICRRFRQLPAFSSIFGTLETVTAGLGIAIDVPANVQGGCIGFTRDAATEILESGVLSSESCVRDWRTTWARTPEMQAVAARGSICDDFILSWAAHKVRIPFVESDEIRSYWRGRVVNDSLRYAVTHPHKIADQSGHAASDRYTHWV